MAATMMTALSSAAGVSVLAVASESEQRAQSFANAFGIPQACTGLASLLSNDEIDAVYVANATENHAKTVISALKAGKAVLCEKPIGISAAENQEIEQEAARSGKLCMEAMWTFCLPSFQRFFYVHDSKELGVASHFYADFGYPVGQDTLLKSYSSGLRGGVLLDRAVYPISLAIRLFGNVKTVIGQVDRNQDNVDVHAAFQLIHQSGQQSQLAVSLTALLQNRAVLSASGGTVSLEPPLLGAELVNIAKAALPSQPVSDMPINAKPGLTKKLRGLALLRRLNSVRKFLGYEHHSYGSNQYLPVINHFCNLYRQDKLVSDIFPLSASTQVLEVIDKLKNL